MIRLPALDFVLPVSLRSDTRCGQCPLCLWPQGSEHPCFHFGRSRLRRTVSVQVARSMSGHRNLSTSPCRIPKASAIAHRALFRCVWAVSRRRLTSSTEYGSTSSSSAFGAAMPNVCPTARPSAPKASFPHVSPSEKGVDRAALTGRCVDEYALNRSSTPPASALDG
jgi:hypothetical protein